MCQCLVFFAGEDAARAVSLLRRQAQDARHQGRYGSEEQLCRDTEALVLGPGRSHARVCNDSCLSFRLRKTVESPQLQSFLFVVILVVVQMQILMVLHHRVSPAAVH